MLTRIATSSRSTSGAGMAGAFAVAGVFLAACASSAPTVEMTPEMRDAGAITSRQVAVTVGLKGELGWEGRPVTRVELGELMRDAAAGSPTLLLVVVPASDDVMYGDVIDVMQMAQIRGIEVRLAEPKASTE